MKRTYKVAEIDKSWAKKTEKPGWQRKLYRARVNCFINHIKNGTFKQSLITVSKRDGGEILLDGQHKVEAIKETDTSYKMDLCVYENLSEEQEMEIYKMLNDVKQQRIIDDIKLYIGRTEWLDAFLDEKNFPVTINEGTTANSIRVDKFLNVIYNGFRPLITRQNLSRKGLPSFIESLDSEKYDLMKQFCLIYKKCFGDPSNDNWLYTRNSVVFTLLRIWIANKDEFDEKTVIKCFKTIEEKSYIKQDASSVDVATLEAMTHKIYRVINKSRSVNKFKEFWIDEKEK